MESKREEQTDYDSQFSGLDNTVDGGAIDERKVREMASPRGRKAWWADVYGVAQSRTQLK